MKCQETKKMSNITEDMHTNSLYKKDKIPK